MKDFLPGREGSPGGREEDNRLFLNEIIWIARSASAVARFTGALWEMEQRMEKIPEVVQKRGMGASFSKAFGGCRCGRVVDRFDGGEGSSACGRSCKRKAGVKENQEGLGKSREGWTSKIHALVDSLGNPVDFVITGGEVHDITQAEDLLSNWKSEAVLGDKGYDSDKLIEFLTERGIQVVISSKRNRIVQREYDKHAYKNRN